MPMHHAHFHFHLPQAGGHFAREQSAADHHHVFLVLGHFPQSKCITHAAQVNDVTQTDTRNRRPPWTAAHREASFIKLDALTVAQHRYPAIDV
jgi:hypothetical protein